MSVTMELCIATAMVAATVVLHLIGLELLLALLRRHRRLRHTWFALIANAFAILVSAFGLFALHTAEIWGWALLYVRLGVLPDLESALYFSTSSYVTIGYGDIVLPAGFRILGAIEGANGIILLGWSTAFFFAVVDRMKLLERELEHPETGLMRQD
jgi:hypothetical protein